MPTCFVMQPFDNGPFDRRYDDVLVPAIKAADLEPYRVDRDDSVSIPIDQIENGIRQSAICLAEITEDNPNVWFELGYAIASGKEVVLICSASRVGKFPFDVQHRTIIRYDTFSPSDFEKLQAAITGKLAAYIRKSEALEAVSDSTQLVAPVEGLTDQEVFALAAVLQNLNHEADHAPVGLIQRDMEHGGYTRVASVLALRTLTQKGFLSLDEYPDSEYNESYFGYSMNDIGWRWSNANQNRFVLKRSPKAPPPKRSYGGVAPQVRTGYADMDDDPPA